MPNFDSDHYPREFSFEEILSIAWNIFKKNYTLIFTLVFVIQLPVNIFTYSFVKIDSFDDAALINMDPSTWLLLILVLIFGLLEPIGIISLVKSITIREKVDFKIIFQRALNALLPVTLTMIIMVLFLSIGILLFILPAIIFGIYWVFTLQVVVVTGQMGIPALRHSFYIVHKRWWRTFLYVLIIGVMSVLVYFIGVGIDELFSTSDMISALIYTLIAVPMSFFTVALAVMFINFNDTIISDKFSYGPVNDGNDKDNETPTIQEDEQQ